MLRFLELDYLRFYGDIVSDVELVKENEEGDFFVFMLVKGDMENRLLIRFLFDFSRDIDDRDSVVNVDFVLNEIFDFYEIYEIVF